MAVVGGYSTLRVHQIGNQTTIGTPVAATRRVPWKGAIVVDPQWTDPDVDSGTIDDILPPSRRGNNVTGTWECEVTSYDDAVHLWAGALKGGVTLSGSSYTFLASATAQDPFQLYTDEWYDDVTTDVIRGEGGTITELEMVWPDDTGPVTFSASVQYADAAVGSPTSPSAPTAGLVVDVGVSPYIYAADTEFYINSSAATIGTTKLTDTFHGGSVKVTTELDLKRFANGSNTRFNVRGYGRTARHVTAEFRFAKQAAVITEVANLLAAATPVKRYVQLKTTSPQSGAPSQIIYLPGYWSARSDDTVGGNDVIVLSFSGKYDTTLTYPIRVNIGTATLTAIGAASA